MLKFLKQFILHPKEVGSVIPSSPELVKLMLEPINFKKADSIVELGPGDGVITKQILKKMKKDAKLTIIEINKDFCKHLQKIKDSRLEIINADAFQLSKHVKHADYIIGGLPLVNFSDKQVDKLLEDVKKIKKYEYIQYHYSPLREKTYRKHFKTVDKKITIKNIPPAMVYTCK